MLAKYFGGAFSIPHQMKLDFYEDILFWYDIYEIQVTEEEIAHEYLYRPDGKPGKLPNPERMRDLVNDRIKERRDKINGAEIFS